ncbi:MAG TPA: radical SAM protein [Thermoanaerobaculia bacterium]|nr:radical SAM protein [Thermoanaerobaculia bacterium]
MTSTLLSPRQWPAQAPSRLAVSPFVHVGPERLYNPLADAFLAGDEAGHAELRGLLTGSLAIEGIDPGLVETLARDRWLLPEDHDAAHAYRLKFVSLEAHTICNQACFFCPVSIAPRAKHFMSTELYERILDQLAAHAATIEGVFMINYNEPTVDPRFVEQVRSIRARCLPPAVLTNATGLTPRRVDELCELGGLRYLSVNLSTLDRDKYRRERGTDQAELVARHIDYAANLPLAEYMEIVVLGEGDNEHETAFAEIRSRYEGTRFQVVSRRLMDRAGYLEVGNTASLRGRRLGGCENSGSRPLQHLHITPYGKCVLCCEDYDESYVVGDLSEQSLDQVLTSEEFARMRRWVYGVEEAPDDFMCRNCVFALSR